MSLTKLNNLITCSLKRGNINHTKKYVSIIQKSNITLILMKLNTVNITTSDNTKNVMKVISYLSHKYKIMDPKHQSLYKSEILGVIGP